MRVDGLRRGGDRVSLVGARGHLLRPGRTATAALFCTAFLFAAVALAGVESLPAASPSTVTPNVAAAPSAAIASPEAHAGYDAVRERSRSRTRSGSRSGSGTAAESESTPKPQVVEVYATYYGWFTNTPPGCATAYSGCAHGTGTYSDPITFASDRKEFGVGTRLYYPTLEKYLVMGDECTECTADWKGKGPDGGPHLHHVDIWIGGKGANAFNSINCEDALTQGTPSGAPLLTPFVLDPPPTLPVSTEAIFDGRTGRCFGGTTTSATYGRYENAATGSCLSIARGSEQTRAAKLETCSVSTGEDLAFEGAFFVAEHRCLQTASGHVGARIVFAKCTGDVRQQWETGPSGDIEWIQYVRCVVDSGGRLVLGSCHTGSASTWHYATEKAPPLSASH